VLGTHDRYSTRGRAAEIGLERRRVSRGVQRKSR
jgi:hypothetical protein